MQGVPLHDPEALSRQLEVDEYRELDSPGFPPGRRLVALGGTHPLGMVAAT